VTRVSECAEDGSEIRLLLTLNVILSLVILGVQGVWIFRAWRDARGSASYQLQVEVKEKDGPLEESLDRPGFKFARSNYFGSGNARGRFDLCNPTQGNGCHARP